MYLVFCDEKFKSKDKDFECIRKIGYESMFFRNNYKIINVKC